MFDQWLHSQVALGQAMVVCALALALAVAWTRASYAGWNWAARPS
jgi:hypothetical protein